MKSVLAMTTACLMGALSSSAFAATTVTLTAEDPQGFFWDAGGSMYGRNALQVYQAFVPNEPSQAFTWTAVSGGYTVCSLKVCLSDSGTGAVLMGGKADVFAITSAGAAQDKTTGRYIQQPTNPGNGAVLTMGYTPTVWKFVSPGGTTTTPVNSSGPVSIMPLGDSITEGYATSSTFAQGGYRCPLDFLLQGAGISFNFVGDSAGLEPGTVTACSQVNWEGHGGYDIAAIQSFEQSDGSVRVAQPHIVLLLAGTNNVAGNETSAITGQLTNLMNNIYAQDPSAWVLISTIPPMNPKAAAASASVAGWATQVSQANGLIRAVAGRYARATLVDYYSAAAGNVGANIGSDGVHPSVTGYGILASLWSNAIKAYLASH